MEGTMHDLQTWRPMQTFAKGVVLKHCYILSLLIFQRLYITYFLNSDVVFNAADDGAAAAVRTTHVI